MGENGECLFFAIMYAFSIFGTLILSLYVQYKNEYYPDYKMEIIQHNLESTPIYDILSDYECGDDNSSNILGYYYGYDYGYLCSRGYNRWTQRYNTYSEGDDDISTDELKPHGEIEYKYFEGKRLCTSKRPNKNYFDYLKFSVGINEKYKTGTKECGKLDINRILCINKDDDCPINDIAYSNKEEYIYNNITYKTVNINDKEFIHYTNQQKKNFIITNLTVLGGDGEGYPCGSNDNNIFGLFESVEKNTYCKGNYTDFKYYYFKNLSTISLDQFYEENKLKEIDLPNYEKNTHLKGFMTLFSTGYFSLNEYDIKNLKNPFSINNNEKYFKTIKKLFSICLTTIIVIGAATFLVILPIYKEASFECEGKKKYITKFIIYIVLILVYLIILICGIIEIAMINKLNNTTSDDIPNYLVNDFVDQMKKDKYEVAYVHVFLFLFLILIITPLAIQQIIKMEIKCFKDTNNFKERKVELTKNMIDETPTPGS